MTTSEALAPTLGAVRREITGTTRLYVVVGDPVDQVQAPMLMNPVFERAALDAVLVPVHAPRERFPTVLAGLRSMANLDGILITIPHKVAASALADLRSPAAEISGSANVLRREPDGRWLADNFDGAGFVRGLGRAGHPVAGARVRLVGAGGAGSAIAAALLDAGCAGLTVLDPDHTRLAELVSRLEAHWPGRTVGLPGTATVRAAASSPPSEPSLDLIVNATPLGLRPDDPLPFDPAELPAGCVVADIIMKPANTRLLRAARAHGLPAHPGIHMLAEQVDLYRAFFDLPGAR
ncbi:shikimate dehydrogenase [Frankia sp. EI5c]|uniref:shikimate dehydrogenase family protein n=1 Tax=Frankia sp. EI5c TaxID=683316 RepID=UPI0007C2BFE7|nr:shikimate dehydrogenase [Frankia sp. EI5c]OAA25879.1 shikimate dehydrogenase [Frankia sp. EI5c]